MIFLLKYLSKINPTIQAILLFCVAAGVASVPVCLAIIIMNTGSISYKNQEVEINLEGKKAANDANYSNRILSEKIIKLDEQLENLRKISTDNPDSLNEQIEQVNILFEDLKPTAEEAINNSEELSDFVESEVSE